MMNRADRAHLDELRVTLSYIAAMDGELADLGRALARAFNSGHRLLAAGNGGSAAQAQHLVAELVGKLDADRPPLPAIALTAETCGITAIGNDYGFEHVFSRQVMAHARSGDVVVLMSTSGRSPNVLAAADAAHSRKASVWAFTGATPSPLADRADRVLAVPARNPQVIQEAHLVLVHLLCGQLDRALGVAAVRELTESSGRR
jgi:phosphoheptose isomerase